MNENRSQPNHSSRTRDLAASAAPGEPPGEANVVVELRWVTSLRWVAAAAIISAATGHALWSGWQMVHAHVVLVGAAVLLYNIIFWRAMQRADAHRAHALAGAQMALDLGVLTLLTVWTGGMASPLLGLFALHMVLASLLLPPLVSYGVGALAIFMMLSGLWLSGQWPHQPAVATVAGGWGAALLLTVFVATRIASKLRRQEADRRSDHSQIKAILDTAAEGIITIDEHGRIRSANPAALKLFGYHADELLGSNVSMLMPQPYRDEHDAYIERYRRTGEARIIGRAREVTGRCRDGREFPLELAVSEVSMPRGRLFTGIVRDMTERKKAESELRALNARLRKQQQAMVQQEKMAAMGQMAAGIAHEIANPLASLDSVLQLARRKSGPLTRETLDTLREQVARIDRIVRDMTSFAHPRGADWQNLPLADVVAGALDMVRFDHRLRAVNVVSTSTSNGETARIMPQALQQVLINMVLNALDAMDGVENPSLAIRTACDGLWHTIEITDNGHGIPPDHMDRIFEPFYTSKPVGQGTGLGLSVSYGLIRQHGGRCEVASEPGRGTTFTIYLPAAAPSVQHRTPAADHS